jgi:ABC-type multidrug transport system fused ATPase/permease subunit
LVLDRADRVVLLQDDRILAEGTHHELMHRRDAASAAYRAVVVRGADEEVTR